MRRSAGAVALLAFALWSSGSVLADGESLAYTATAAMLTLRNDHNQRLRRRFRHPIGSRGRVVSQESSGPAGRVAALRGTDHRTLRRPGRRAFITAFTAYAKNELNRRSDRPYRALPGDISSNWNFHRRGFFGRVLAPTVIPDLREALHLNPNLRVFAASGLFDLATPFYTTEYELANVGLDPAVRARMTFGSYASGHMIYLDNDALPVLRADLGRFYAAATSERTAARNVFTPIANPSARPPV